MAQRPLHQVLQIQLAVLRPRGVEVGAEDIPLFIVDRDRDAGFAQNIFQDILPVLPPLLLAAEEQSPLQGLCDALRAGGDQNVVKFVGPGQTVAHAVPHKQGDALLVVEADDALLHLLLALKGRVHGELHRLVSADQFKQCHHAVSNIGKYQKGNLASRPVHGQFQAAEDVIGGKSDVDYRDAPGQHGLSHHGRLPPADDHVVAGQVGAAEKVFHKGQRQHFDIQIKQVKFFIVIHHIADNPGKSFIGRDDERLVFFHQTSSNRLEKGRAV